MIRAHVAASASRNLIAWGLFCKLFSQPLDPKVMLVGEDNPSECRVKTRRRRQD